MSPQRSESRSAPRRGGSGLRDNGRTFERGGGGRGSAFYNSGARFRGQGHIERIVRCRGGYHVFLGGWGYPFFVPYRFYNPFRFRLGLFIGFNAFYDPLGYYSVYGWPGYYPYRPADVDSYSNDSSYYRDGDENTDGVLRGTVQSIDLHTGLVVIDDASHQTVTALLPPRDRRVDDIRPGDYVEFSGGWNRSGQFDADRMERFEPRR